MFYPGLREMSRSSLLRPLGSSRVAEFLPVYLVWEPRRRQAIDFNVPIHK